MIKNGLLEASMSRIKFSIAHNIATISFISIALCVSCQTSKPFPVSQISFKGLCGMSVEQFRDMDEPDAIRWLESSYGPISRLDTLGEDVVKLWTKSENSPAAFLRHGHLFQILRSYPNGPSFGQVSLALGTPDSTYGIWYPWEKINYGLGLDFPQQGITVYMNKGASARDLNHDGQLEIKMGEGFIVDLIECYLPKSSMEEVLRGGFPSDPKSIDINLKRRKPWAGFGSWVALEP
jgi:hypothetical protein